jgi:hypothetical protein
MKKIYMTPELEEIKIKSNMSLLAGSPTVTGGGDADLGWGGDGTGVEPGAPELPGMPSITPEGLLGFPF